MSPNDYPEDELALTSGDFIYIFGDPDADGFFTAELMSGERGYVSSQCYLEFVFSDNEDAHILC